MGLTGKYKFEGIQEFGADTIQTAFAGSPFLKFPFVNAILKLLLNLLANKGLVVANLGAYKLTNWKDGKVLNAALENGIQESESGKVLSPADIKRIDDDVIAAARKALPYGRKPTKP